MISRCPNTALSGAQSPNLKNLRRSFDPVQVAGYMLDRGWMMPESIIGGIVRADTPDARQPSAMRNASGNIPFYAT